MTQPSTTYVKTGLFVVTGTIIAVIMLIVFGAGSFFEQEVLVETYFDATVQGLDVGSEAKFRGIQIGNVKSISLVPNDYSPKSHYVMVVVAIKPRRSPIRVDDDLDKHLEDAIRRGLRFRLAPKGLTGTMFLEADFLDPEAFKPLPITWTPERPYIPSAPNTITLLSDSLSKIMKNLEELNLGGLTQHADDMLVTLNDKIKAVEISKISQEILVLLKSLQETTSDVKAIVRSEETRRILKNADAAFAKTSQIINQAEKPVGEAIGDIRDAARRIQALSDRTDTALARIPEAMDALMAILIRFDRLAAAKETDVSDAVYELRKTAENLSELTESLKTYPSQLILGDPPPESGVVK